MSCDPHPNQTSCCSSFNVDTMLSNYPQLPPVSTKDTCQQQGTTNKLGDFQGAIDSFTKLIVRSGTSDIRLHCSVPTWSCSTETCLDLHDLHELRSRFLMFIHKLIQSLRSSGISASYSLAPLSSSRCLICVLPPKAVANQTQLVNDLQRSPKFNVTLKREQAMLVHMEDSPCLIIT